MKFEIMTEEAQQTAISMIEYCLNNQIGCGMDGGFEIVDSMDDSKDIPKPFRLELTKFVKDNQK